MARPAHPEAMAPSSRGRTRTAPPRMPSEFPAQGRYRSYVLFDATGLIYLALGFLAIRVVQALGGPEWRWRQLQESFENPLYLLFHVVSLASVVFVGVRFFSLFPKAQPPRIGPLRPPPQNVIVALLYGGWAVVTGLLVAVLCGAFL